jgi:hypothetical protein
MPSGYRHSEETRRKMSESRRGEKNPNYGKNHTEETKKRIGDANRGRHPSEETRRKMSDSKRGRKLSEEHKRRAAEGLKKRHAVDPTIRKKISDRLTGMVRSDETRKRISDAKKGYVYSDERNRRVSAALKGRKLSDEQRMKRMGRRPSDETRRKLSGENNHCWKGGISFEPYCPKFNDAFRERVREFFGRRCVECGTPENGRKLAVHHVNFNKMTCCDGTKPLFVSLCASCHSKTNFDREYWEEHFTAIIEEQYGGECYMKEAVAEGA